MKKRIATLGLSVLLALPVIADTCLNTDKEKYADNDVRHSDYGKCKPAAGAPDNSYNSLNAIGSQIQSIMQREDTSNDRISDEEDQANRRAITAFIEQQSARRSLVKYGAPLELNDINAADYQYQNASISVDRQQAIRQEIGDVINNGKLLETYGDIHYENSDVWKNTTDAEARWKNCELATQLVRAYVYGDFIKPEQKNPELGYQMAKTGALHHCGGTAYWLGRIFEAGNVLVPEVDKDKDGINGGREIKWAIESAYNTAILNGFTSAYERMAELYRLGGPKRFRGTKHFVFADFASYPNWRVRKNNSDEMYLMRVQYSKCLEAEPANIVCARGLAIIYADQGKDFLDDYTNYNAALAAYYADYVKKLEALLTKAGLPIPKQEL